MRLTRSNLGSIAGRLTKIATEKGNSVTVGNYNITVKRRPKSSGHFSVFKDLYNRLTGRVFEVTITERETELGERQSVSLNGGDPEEIKNAIWNECGKIAKNNFKKILAKLRNCKNSSDVSKALYGKIFKIKGKSYSAHEALLDGPEDANLQRDAKKYLKELGKVVDKLIKAESKASKQSTEKEISLDSLNRLKMHRSEIRKRIDSTHSGRAMIDLKSSTHFPKDD